MKNKKRKPRQSNSSITPSEILWNGVLKRKKLNGYLFAKNKIVGGMKADFYCQELKMIIIIDNKAVGKHFREHKEMLETFGYIVMRITDEQINKNLDLVQKKLLRNAKPNPFSHSFFFPFKKGDAI